MTDDNNVNAKAATKRERDLARRLIVREAGGDESTGGLVLGAERAFNRLHRNLSLQIGADGFDALAKRALHLAALECPVLDGVTIETTVGQFRFQGLEASVRQSNVANVDEGVVAVVANFFWLLVTFVGDNLFNRIIRKTWPNAASEGTRLDVEGDQA